MISSAKSSALFNKGCGYHHTNLEWKQDVMGETDWNGRKDTVYNVTQGTLKTNFILYVSVPLILNYVQHTFPLTTDEMLACSNFLSSLRLQLRNIYAIQPDIYFMPVRQELRHLEINHIHPQYAVVCRESKPRGFIYVFQYSRRLPSVYTVNIFIIFVVFSCMYLLSYDEKLCIV